MYRYPVNYAHIVSSARKQNKDPLDILAEKVEHLNGRANTAAINGYFRFTDTSIKFPVNGRFDIAERAIRKVRAFNRESGSISEGIEYIKQLDDQISEIVNAC